MASNNSDRKTQPIGALVETGNVRVIVVGGACPEGLTFSLGVGTHAIGRTANGVLLKEDETVSPKHGSFVVSEDGCEVRDEGSLNGIYRRIRGAQAISHGDWFRCGGQTFRFEQLATETEFPTEDGTHVFTSPRRKGSFRVAQVLEGGKAGLSSTSSDDSISIGCDGTHVTFTSDPFLSGEHCRVYASSSGGYLIEDLDSTNGTYVRVDGAAPVGHGDFLYVGNELLRVEVS